MNQLDEIICSFDRGLRTLTGGHQAVRDYPGANFSEAPLSEEERAHIVGLMRVNHTGEVCAQALYEGQALTAKGEDAKSALLAAAGITETIFSEHVGHGVHGLGFRHGHSNPLTGRQTVCFDHNGGALLANIGRSFGHVGKALIGRRGNIMTTHKVFAERLRAL